MKFTIDGSKIGLSKDLTVVSTVKNVRYCMKAELRFAKVKQAIDNVDTQSDQSLIDVLEQQTELFKEYTEFLEEIFGLTKKQVDKVNNSDATELTITITKIISKILGYDKAEDSTKDSKSTK